MVSFIDDDDMEMPHHNALLSQQFNCFPERVIVLGMRLRSRETSMDPSFNKYQEDTKASLSCSKFPATISGSELYGMMSKAQDRGYFMRELAQGQPAVRRKSVMGFVAHNTMPKTEDYIYIQDVMLAYGKRNAQKTAAVFREPWNTYYSRSRSTWTDLE